MSGPGKRLRRVSEQSRVTRGAQVGEMIELRDSDPNLHGDLQQCDFGTAVYLDIAGPIRKGWFLIGPRVK